MRCLHLRDSFWPLGILQVILILLFQVTYVNSFYRDECFQKETTGSRSRSRLQILKFWLKYKNIDVQSKGSN